MHVEPSEGEGRAWGGTPLPPGDLGVDLMGLMPMSK